MVNKFNQCPKQNNNKKAGKKTQNKNKTKTNEKQNTDIAKTKQSQNKMKNHMRTQIIEHKNTTYADVHPGPDKGSAG